MYFRILKNDLKRKRTMNIILLTFIMLAAMFIASSINNMATVMTALDRYFEKANVPDYWFATVDEEDIKKFTEFAAENEYDYTITKLIQTNPQEIVVDGEKFDYSNTSCISALNTDTSLFDENNNVVKKINDGEIYIPAAIANSDKNDFSKGNTIEITAHGKTKSFIIKGKLKDSQFGSPMMGMTRFLVSENDYKFFEADVVNVIYSVNIYTTDEAYYNKVLELDLNTIFNIDKAGIKMTYMMEMLTAGIFLAVSICLILISMVILKFTISFTMSEEYREIGVMKAIGLKAVDIRKLYIVKYFAMSVAGAVIGFGLSIPFENMMLKDTSENILIQSEGSIWINGVCAVFTALVVVFFCFMSTGRIKKFSPIDAIRNGQSGERFKSKSRLSLGKSRLKPMVFMALNDILSGIRRFVSMLLIFSLGLMLIVIPANTISTLQSDSMLKWFNMAGCDHLISEEIIFSDFSENSDIKKELIQKLENIKKFLRDNGIEAEVYQEVMFRMTISANDKKASSLAFQGINGVVCEEYDYLEGEAPKNVNEVAVTKYVCEKIDAGIGDYVYINTGSEVKQYIITATYQSMNNMGEGIRFYQDETLDYKYTKGSFAVQIRYKDNPTSKQLEDRKNLLAEKYAAAKVFTAGEYSNYMIGDVAGQLESIRMFILAIVVVINMLVTTLMVKSFITKEKNEIALLKAMGFKNRYIAGWQTLRIGIVLLLSAGLSLALSMPLTKLIITPIFKMMGAESIKFHINPLEVYVIYPLIILAAATLAAMVTSLQAGKISTSEISNME